MASLPLLWLSAAFLAGILLGSWQPLTWQLWIGLAAAAFLVGLFEGRLAASAPVFKNWRKISPLPLGILLAALLAGAGRYSMALPSYSPGDLAYYNDRGEVQVTGLVVAAPEVKATGTILRLQIKDLAVVAAATAPPQPLPVHGLLRANLLPGGDWQYGDLISLQGKLVTPSNSVEFSYRDYLARQAIYSQMGYPKATLLQHAAGSPVMTALDALRTHSFRVIDQILPQPEAALLNGILLGLDNEMPDDLSTAYQRTGTAHIIAISGFNIAIIAGLFSIFFGKLVPRGWAALLTILAVVFYTLLVGAGPSVVRAAIMGSLSLLGQLIGRRQSGLNTLAFVAALMCLDSPTLLWDVSFLLTFGATLGLVLFAARFQGAFENLVQKRFSAPTAGKLAGLVGEYCLFTLAAQLTTLPVTLFTYERLSPTALLANPLVLPPQPALMVLGGIALLGGLVYLPLGHLLGYLAWPLLAYTNRSVEFFNALSGDNPALGKISLWAAMLFYAVLIGLAFWRPRQNTGHPVLPRLVPAGLLVAGLLSVVAWQSVVTLPDGRLHLTVLAADDAPVVLVESPGGNRLLVNGQRDSRALSSYLGRHIPLFGHRLDGLLLTGASAGALKGLPAVLNRFPAQAAFWSRTISTSTDLDNLQVDLTAQMTPIHLLDAGQVLDLGGGVHARVLAASADGIALLLEYGNFSVLLPGGITPETLSGVEIRRIPDALVLGSKDAISPSGEELADWSQFQPGLVVWQGDPRLLQSSSPAWLNLAEHGWAALSSDGEKMWLQVER
jgi:competence protein ComEC